MKKTTFLEGNYFRQLSLVILILLTCGFAKAITPVDTSYLNRTLEKVLELDQQVRINDNGSDESISKMVYQDSINQSIVIPIIEQYGWYDKISQNAAECYFYVLQHSSTEVQKKFSDFIKLGFDKKYVSTQDYAMFTDRLSVRQSKFQTYGTQSALFSVLNNTYVYPVVDASNLDARRISVGLEPNYDSLSQKYVLLQIDNNSDEVIILGHIAKQNFSIPTPDVSIFIGETYMTKTNQKGFFQFVIKRPLVGTVIPIVIETDGVKKTMNYKIDNQQDFYELNLSLR